MRLICLADSRPASHAHGRRATEAASRADPADSGQSCHPSVPCETLSMMSDDGTTSHRATPLPVRSSRDTQKPASARGTCTETSRKCQREQKRAACRVEATSGYGSRFRAISSFDRPPARESMRKRDRRALLGRTAWKGNDADCEMRVSAALVLATTISASVLAQTFVEDFSTMPVGVCYPDGTARARGSSCTTDTAAHAIVSPNGNAMLFEQPAAAAETDESHASLVVGPAITGDFTLKVSTATTRQLRTGSPPNPWEVAWVLWHYTDNSHFYYFVAKPNGWELGKEDPAYPGAQRFLATGATPVIPDWARVPNQGVTDRRHHPRVRQRPADRLGERRGTALFLRPRRLVQRRCRGVTSTITVTTPDVRGKGRKKR